MMLELLKGICKNKLCFFFCIPKKNCFSWFEKNFVRFQIYDCFRKFHFNFVLLFSTHYFSLFLYQSLYLSSSSQMGLYRNPESGFDQENFKDLTGFSITSSGLKISTLLPCIHYYQRSIHVENIFDGHKLYMDESFCFQIRFRTQ